MNKSELIENIAEEADLAKAEAGRALDAALRAIADTLRNGEPVSLVGFGTFQVRHRAPRSGHNPATGEAIQIAASTTVAFKPGKALKDSVN